MVGFSVNTILFFVLIRGILHKLFISQGGLTISTKRSVFVYINSILTEFVDAKMTAILVINFSTNIVL